MTDTGPEGELVYVLLMKIGDDNRPSDFERLMSQLKGVESACYYLASVLREMDTSRFSDRMEEE